MISKKMAEALKGGSEIRKMFEEGGRLKAIYGADNVYDFSIGNPDLEPPKEVFDALKDLANNPTPGMHGYMPNAGYPSTRQIVAEKRGKEAGMEIGPDAVCMTVGAASAMNDVLHSILDADDEVILLAPYFMEYNGYVANHNGKVVIVQTDDKFMPVIADIEKAITSKTKAIIVNSPNNPSGVVYPAELLAQLNEMLKKQDHTIYVISDDPGVSLCHSPVRESVIRSFHLSALTLPSSQVRSFFPTEHSAALTLLLSGRRLSKKLSTQRLTLPTMRTEETFFTPTSLMRALMQLSPTARSTSS